MTTLTAPTIESCKIVRDHLTATEVKLLIEAVKSQGGWYSYRNSILILMLYRHGLRRSEAACLRWSDIDLSEGTIYIRRIKGSRSGRHPLQGDEMRALKKLKRAERTFTFCIY
jgi:integrase